VPLTFEVIAETLRERICSGGLRPGDALPTQASAALITADLAPGHPRGRHQQGSGQHAPQAAEHVPDDGPVPARGAVRLRRLPEPQ
jgi:hypothetical protein